MAPTGYEPKIQIQSNVCGGNYIVKLGQYNIFVFNPKSFCRFSCCLHPKTFLIPKRNALLTFFFIVCCFVALEYLASIFAARPLTKLTLLMDFGLVLGTVNAGIATSTTDPGILPPELASEGENEPHDQAKSSSSSSSSSHSFKRRAASIDQDLFDQDQQQQENNNREATTYDPLAITTTNPYLVAAGTHPEYERDRDDLRLSNCKHCTHMRPQKSAHCPKCHTCILGFDHHCGFLQMDIGERNLRHFIVFLVHCFLCVAMSAAAFIKPWFYLMFFKDGELIENSNATAVALFSIALTAWALLLFFMSLNYLVMAFVPGSKSTRELWRKWCGSKNKSAATSDPLPDWHPGYKRQQQEQQEKLKEDSEMRVWKILCGVHPSLLPAWSNDLLNLEDEKEEELAAIVSNSRESLPSK
jgi:hypothetical protein